jgi:DNA-nicking Smr family endonuclease
MNRKKRLRKGIDSLDEEINLHEAKLEAAKQAGNEGLTKYYDRELDNLRKQRDNKKRILDK